MNCRNCRRVIPFSDNFCAYCGAETSYRQPGFFRRNKFVIALATLAILGLAVFAFVFLVNPAAELSKEIPFFAGLDLGPAKEEVTPEPTAIPTLVPAPTPQPTDTPIPTPTPTPTPVPTATPTPQPTYTPYPTTTPQPTYTPYPTVIPTPTPTATPTPTPRPTATPTLRPTATPTPRPTRVPWVLREAKYADPEYTISVPSVWSGGRVTFFAKEHSSTPASWVQRNTIRGAYRYDISSLGDAGVKLVGTYFKERYSSDELCGERGFVVIRESALVLDYRHAGIAVHVDVCEADLYLEAEPGMTNEAISRRIIQSLLRTN